jgi:PBP1b-binding outer membrane lipoprotein LpoB
MKKFFAIMIAVSVFALASCGGNADTAVSSGADSTAVDTTVVDSTIVETPADTTVTK